MHGPSPQSPLGLRPWVSAVSIGYTRNQYNRQKAKSVQLYRLLSAAKWLASETHDDDFDDGDDDDDDGDDDDDDEDDDDDDDDDDK